jgi:anaphase-promoting complex subunit 4
MQYITDNTPVIISVSIKSDKLCFKPFDGNSPGGGDAVPCDEFLKYDLPGEKPLRPVRLEAHDKADVRGEIPARICLLGSNRTVWQTFTLPTSA